MKINWKDPFGKKRIAQLEAENSILNDMLGQQTKYIRERKELKIQKFKVNYSTRDNWVERPENKKYIKRKLCKKLAEELDEVITFHGWFDDRSLTYEFTASVEVVC